MTNQNALRLMPSNIEAEQALLGILLFDHGRFRDVEGIVKALDFYLPVHQLIFTSVWVMQTDGKMPTGEAITERLKHEVEFARMGGRRYLADLADRAPFADQVVALARLVAEVAVRRRLVGLTDAVRDEAILGRTDANQLISRAEWGLAEVAHGAGFSDNWLGGQEMAAAAVDAMDGTGGQAHVKTGIAAWDNYTGGLPIGRVSIGGGRPGVGKSLLATNVGVNVARAGLGAAIFSMEMDVRELGLRCACAAAYRSDSAINPIYFNAIKQNMSSIEKERMMEGVVELRELPLHIDQRPGLRPSDIGPAAKRLLRQWDKRGIAPGVIIVDHLMIVRPDQPSGNKVVDMTEVSGFFRDFAREVGVAILLLCQLNRNSVDRRNTDKMPGIQDLGWSGAIEQDAAQVVLMHRPSEHLKEPPEKASDVEMGEYLLAKERWKDRGLLLVRKNRSGPGYEDIEVGMNMAHNTIWSLGL